VPLLLLRHATAGHRDAWEGDDRERPIDDRGLRQAEAIVDRLQPFPIARILTSPYLRCVQTVEPLAAARGLELELRPELGDELQATEGAVLVRAIAGEDAVVCGHGGLEHAVLARPPRWRKGATIVIGPGLEVVDLLPPP
jgi:8-oxo-(d)GTP phosphatase